ncbi:OPT oligopeptide transporter protein-domain-containing protein [Catenaria anguillulae PL171]|uniref:OPT oligopeptide transporter protein-domain-containing protein n=1 Tax=Catenaria anguillulae PL171 TaxID=765915 RepID=A0A1Y2HJN5_9FUNG|nr:OPT oligopeptide transporter protein-domain-containing protein [Catenaria anguillulae PL171]
MPSRREHKSDAKGLSTRALGLGLLMGIVPAASGLYLGLKTGWGFGSTFFSVLLGYPFLKFVDRLRPHSGGASLQEHCVLVSMASAVSNLTMSGWVNGIPALYKLGLLNRHNFAIDMLRLCVWSSCLSVFAVMVAMFLAPHFLSRTDLPFPSSTGAAHLMLQMHKKAVPHTSSIATGLDGVPSVVDPEETGNAVVQVAGKANAEPDPPTIKEDEARRIHEAQVAMQQRVLLTCLGFSFGYLFVAHALPALKEFHFFWFLGGQVPRAGPHPGPLERGFKVLMFQLERFNIFFSVSFAFFGAGMMMGIRNASSFIIGSFTAWFLVGHFAIERLGWIPSAWDQAHRIWKSPARMNPADPGVGYWLLWPGITLLMTNAVIDLVLNLVTQLVAHPPPVVAQTHPSAQKSGKTKSAGAHEAETNDMPTPTSIMAAFRRPSGVLLIGGFTAFMAAAVVTRATFKMQLFTSYLALILGVMLTFVGASAAGATDMNPTGTLAKVTKCVFSFIPAPSQTRHQMYSLAGAMVSTGTSSQAVSLICDYKFGSICRTPVRSQFKAQILGALLAAPVTTSLFALYVHAYPCIILVNDDPCVAQGFTLTAANTWKVFAVAMTDSSALSRIPMSSLAMSWVMMLVVAATSVLKRWFVPKSAHWLFPHWNAIGVAMLTPRIDFAMTTFAGAVAGLVWLKKSPATYELLMFTVASGLIAGEGMWGLMAALCNIAGVPEGWLSRVGLPR